MGMMYPLETNAGASGSAGLDSGGEDWFGLGLVTLGALVSFTVEF
jgi:hypothetical protein